MIYQGHKGATAQRRRCWLIVHVALLLLVLSCFVDTARAALLNGQAVQCEFGKMVDTAWREVKPLTTDRVVGDVLWERYVDLPTQYSILGAGGKAHELVSAGYWSRGTLLVDGVAETNVRGIGFKIAVRSSDGVSRTIVQAPDDPIALEKTDVQYLGSAMSSSMLTRYTLSLVLTVPASQLPAGKLEVTHVDGSAGLVLYAVDLPKGVAMLGQPFKVPTEIFPPGICRKLHTISGTELIGESKTLPKTCVVVTKNVTRPLGHFTPADFPAIDSVSPPSEEVRLQLSDCSAIARPQVSFTDASSRRCESGILGLLPSSGKVVAQGIGIVMFNDKIRRIHCATPYEVERIAGTNNASFNFRAQYIRIGHVTPGDANGAVTFEFTFP